MNSQKVRAIKRTLGVLAVATLAPVVVFAIFEYISLQTLGYAGLALLVSYFVYITYQINLGRIQYEDQLTETLKSFKE